VDTITVPTTIPTNDSLGLARIFVALIA
jgi:hypothetical protein